jgi:hypothetical protein
MSGWLRPLVRAGIVLGPPGYLVFEGHRWLAMLTFVVLLAVHLLHRSWSRDAASAARERANLTYAWQMMNRAQEPTVRTLRPVDGGVRIGHTVSDHSIYDDQNDSLIHFPPRRS